MVPLNPFFDTVHGETLRARRHQIAHGLKCTGRFAMGILLGEHGRRLVADFEADDHDLQHGADNQPGENEGQKRPRQRRESHCRTDGEKTARTQAQKVRQHVDERRHVLGEFRSGTQDPV